MTRGRVAQVIDDRRYAEHVRTRFAGVVTVDLEVDLSPSLEGLRRLVEAGERCRPTLPCGCCSGPWTAEHLKRCYGRHVHRAPVAPETRPGARTGDRSAAGDCPIPRGGDRPSHGGVETTRVRVRSTCYPYPHSHNLDGECLPAG